MLFGGDAKLKDFRIVNDAHRLIVNELQKVRPQKSTNQGVMICCPFHDDGTPSLSVNLTHGRKPVGLWYCFGCGQTGLWNKLAKKMRLHTVDERAAQQMTEFHGRKANSKLLSVEPAFDKAIREWELDFVEPWPEDQTWRGFPGSFLQGINVRLAVDTKKKQEVVLLTVTVGAEEYGYVKALLKKVKGQLSYVNSAGEWSSRWGLFGYDLAAKLLAEGATTLYVVEGPRDALRLLYYGIPAVAVLGANIWSSAKRDLLLGLGATTIVLWMDNDTAGVTATNKLRRALKQYSDIEYVNARKLLKRAQKHYGYTKDKIDVASCPLKLYRKTVGAHYPKCKAGGWKAAYA